MTRRRRGTAITGIVVLGIGLAFGSGYLVGRPGSGAHSPVTDRVLAAGPPAGGAAGAAVGLAGGDLRPADSCEDLLAHYVDRGLDLVGPWGWGLGGGVVMLEEELGVAGAPTGSDARASAPTVDRSESGDSGTNVQEAGVDEPDVVKTDGRLLVRVQDDLLTTYSLSSVDEPGRLDALDLPGLVDAEILLAGDTVVAIGADPREDGPEDELTGERHGTRMVVVDVSDPSAMSIIDAASFDAGLVAARLHGTAVRLALTSGLPRLDFVQAGDDLGERGAEERNRDLVRTSTLSDWLPDVTPLDAGGAAAGDPALLVDCASVAVPDDDALGTLTLLGLDVADPATWDASAVATASRTTYFSSDRMVLASSPAWGWGWGWGCCSASSTTGIDDGVTRLHTFALDGIDATYAAAGEVDGAVRDRWAMDMTGGVLRLAVGASVATGNFSSVVTLAEDQDALVELGRVDELGVDEEIKAVRWFDDLAIVVTFRQVDPLYAVDLTSPSAPVLLGELKIPGFSEYLHPLGSQRLVGIGQDASLDGRARGAQAALFDVRDLTAPRRLDVVRYGPEYIALAGADPRQFTWLPEQRTVLTVVADGYGSRTGYVSVLRLADGTLRDELVEVEYGQEVDQVRLVAVADGRVVLVTGDAVSYFDV